MTVKSLKQIKTEYKESVIPAGVWAIRNTANNRKFIGSTVNVHSAWNRHKFQLQGNIHANKQLQEEWNRYSESSFQFEILITLLPKNDPLYDIAKEIKDLEELYINEMRLSGDFLYNKY